MPEISSDEMDRDFRAALAELAADVPGLKALDCGTWGIAAPLARLCFDGEAGGWYVHVMLRPDAGTRAENWATRASAVWVPEEGERRYALDILIGGGTGRRDPRLLAVLVLTAVLADHEAHAGGA